MNRFLTVLVVLGVSLYGVYHYYFPYYSWHQKMTLEVQADGRAYTGSSVVEMWVRGYPNLPMAASRALGVRGEAAVVKLPGDRYMFALLTYNAFLAADVFKQELGRERTRPGEGWARALSKLRKMRDIPPVKYPLLVTFDDLEDPASVKKVDPNDLVAAFGSGVKLKRITLGITDEPVTKGRVEKVVRKTLFQTWAKIHKRAYERGLGDSYFDSFLASLSRRNFVRD